MIGKTISHYLILEKLGEGGMGAVYKAHDTKLDRFVALKFLPGHLTANETDRARFLQEARAAAGLNHPNICVIHEIQDEGEHPFIAMEYVEGETLKEMISRVGARRDLPKDIEANQLAPIQMNTIIDLAIQIGEGLSVAHKKGVVHRDVKSDNIMVASKNQVKIMDFGLAKLRGSVKLTKSSSTMGTMAYTSPENIQGRDVDARSDIFSFGIVLYEMLTRRLPFKGEYESAMMYAIVNEEPEPIQKYRTDLTSEWLHVLARALEKNPEERYQTIQDMVIDLKRLRRGSGVIPVQPDIDIPVVIQRRLPLGILIMVSVILLILFVGYLFLKKPAEDIQPISVAVIGFENQTGDTTYDYLQKAIPNLLITSLEQSQYLRVTSWERLQDLLRQSGRGKNATIDKDTGFELCRRDAIEAIVLGTFTKAGQMFATDTKVLNVNSKKLISSTSSRGEGVQSILSNQIDDLSKGIFKGLGKVKRDEMPVLPRIQDVTTISMEAYFYFLKGKEADERWHYEEALSHLEKAVQLDPTFATAYLNLAIVYGSLGKDRNRTETLTKARFYSQKATEKERLFIEAYYHFFGKLDPPKGYQILQSIVEKYPQEKLAHYRLGLFYSVYEKSYEKAAQAFLRTLQLDPEMPDAMNQLAYTYLDLRDYPRALAYFEKYRAVHPNDPNPLDSLGDVYFIMGDLEKAMGMYLKALNKRPDFSSSRKISYLYSIKENYPEGMAWSEKYMATHPAPALKGEAVLFNALMHFLTGKRVRISEDLHSAAELAEKAGNEYLADDIIWFRAWLAFETDNYDDGVKHINTWYATKLKRRPFHKPYYNARRAFYLGVWDVKKENTGAARSRLEKIKKWLPEMKGYPKKRVDYYFNTLDQKLLVHDGQTEKADNLKHTLMALESTTLNNFLSVLYYNLVFDHDLLARTLAEKGELDKAISEYEKLVTFKPQSTDRRLIIPLHHYRLARLYEKRGAKEKAVKEYETFLRIWKDADEGLPEKVAAEKRLAGLREK